MKNKIIKGFALLLLLGSYSMNAQTKIGDDLYGKTANDNFGTSIALSADGSIMAVGSPYNDTKYNNAGQVTIYKNIDGIWSKIGNGIDGQWQYDTAGISLDISNDGNIVAIGSPANTNNGTGAGQVRVFKNIDGVWTQLGNEILGQSAGDNAGNSVALSSDGLTMIIGAYNYKKNGVAVGQARVFKFENESWTQIGSDINGENTNDFCGKAVSISNDGKIVAVGSPYAKGENDTGEAGRVKVYKNVDGNWVQLGKNILGQTTDYIFGSSLSLNGNGTIIAIGDPRNEQKEGMAFNAGHVRLYYFDGNNWTLTGPNFQGENLGDALGQSVSISSEGNVLAIAAPYNAGLYGCQHNPCNFGLVRIYQYVDNTWLSIGEDIYGEKENDRLGTSVSLSADGKKLAVSAPYNDKMGTDSGQVKVYDLSPVLSTNKFVMDRTNVYPNPVKDQLYINLQNDLNLQEVNVFTVTGQLIKTFTNNENIQMGSFAKGLYLVQIVTDKGNATKKIRVE